MDVDLSNLTLVQVFTLSALLVVIDVGAAIVFAVAQGKFSLGAVAIWLQSHVLVRVFPILALAVLGKGFEPVLPAIPPAFGLALVGLLAYLLETVASVQASSQNASRPQDVIPSA